MQPNLGKRCLIIAAKELPKRSDPGCECILSGDPPGEVRCLRAPVVPSSKIRMRDETVSEKGDADWHVQIEIAE